MNTIFQRKIGMIFDVCQSIMCKTAPRENWINHFVLTGNESTDLQYIEDILKNFPAPSHRMALLGFCNKKKGSFIQKLFETYVNDNCNNWDLIGFTDYICDDKLLKDQLSSFYFPDYEGSCPLSKISSSIYPDNIKTLLYEFFLFTTEFVIEIKEELTKYILIYERYYEHNLSRILDFQESFDYSKFSSSTSSRQIKLNKRVNTYCISISLLSQYTIIGSDNNEFGWLVLGTSYMKVLPNNEVAIDVSGFGNALGDKIRTKIVELLVKKGEMTLADLSKEIGIVNTITIYHLDILKKEKLILHRHQGRKVLYCLNINQIKKSLEALVNLCGLQVDL